MDLTPIIVSAISSLPALLAWWEAHQAKKNSARAVAASIENKGAIDEVHKLVNSQTDKLVKAATEAATAVGEAAGVEKERVRTENK